MKILSKQGNFEIIIDKRDYKRIMDFAPNGWEARFFTGNNIPYVVTRKTIEVDGVKKRKQFMLHRFIMNSLGEEHKDIHIDHKNNNPLDNRRSNLRPVNRFQNMKNRSSSKNGSSKYLGVSCCETGKSGKKYRVSISEPKIKSGNIHLGYYTNEDTAGYAYNLAALKLHGEYANLNNINVKKVDKEVVNTYLAKVYKKYNI